MYINKYIKIYECMYFTIYLSYFFVLASCTRISTRTQYKYGQFIICIKEQKKVDLKLQFIFVKLRKKDS